MPLTGSVNSLHIAISGQYPGGNGPERLKDYLDISVRRPIATNRCTTGFLSGKDLCVLRESDYESPDKIAPITSSIANHCACQMIIKTCSLVSSRTLIAPYPRRPLCRGSNQYWHSLSMLINFVCLSV